MKHLKKLNNIKLILILALAMMYSCVLDKDNTANQPQLEAYQLGEKWEWTWKRSINGKINAEGETFEQVINDQTGLAITNGTDTIQIASEKSKKGGAAYLKWPLRVGKKWVFDEDWESYDGTKGHTNQEGEILSYEEIKVKAGNFKAFKIQLKGTMTNERGYNGKTTDTWWYAPALKHYIKHTQDDGEGLYIKELIAYSHVN